MAKRWIEAIRLNDKIKRCIESPFGNIFLRIMLIPWSIDFFMKMSASLQNSNSPSNKLHLIPFTEQHFSILIGWFFSEKDIVQWGGPDLSYPLDDA
ncbi:hypothetical protein [Candidatus Symbiopectobacterium sp. 'North America']|uniref:hypothetical protein n=1 Tax=Candidatus Symbiopectobacterium sp. 'North America' TaxID=2794574 RepID=UPI0018C953DD|nr:hypothetical protein [Candidatus Symbiopectobacterium sp. 'North America']